MFALSDILMWFGLQSHHSLYYPLLLNGAKMSPPPNHISPKTVPLSRRFPPGFTNCFALQCQHVTRRRRTRSNAISFSRLWWVPGSFIIPSHRRHTNIILPVKLRSLIPAGFGGDNRGVTTVKLQTLLK